MADASIVSTRVNISNADQTDQTSYVRENSVLQKRLLHKIRSNCSRHGQQAARVPAENSGRCQKTPERAGTQSQVFMRDLSFVHLGVFMYGCETWTLTLREERKLRVFENMVLRRIFGPRRDDVTGE